MSLYDYFRAAKAFVLKNPMWFAVGALFIGVAVLGMLCGCSVRPGIVSEKTADGPDGVRTEKTFTGVNLGEITGGGPMVPPNVKIQPQVNVDTTPLLYGLGALALVGAGILLSRKKA